MPPTTTIVKLDTQIQPYGWGSRTAIAQLQGRPVPTEAPEAELWIGDHPNGPSRVLEATGMTPLRDWCAARGEAALGPGRQQLPYLVKILAAGEPLSIQLHPNAQQAADGYAREQAAGIPLGDPERSYSDTNSKVEALCALGRFEALCGFRPGGEVRRFVANSHSRVASDLLTEIGSEIEHEELAGALFRLVLRLSSEDPPRARRLADEMTRYGERESDAGAEAMWIRRLAAVHPGDRMLIAPLLLNLMVLERGEALEVSPNTVHSYLSGLGVEVLTSSDNVVRAGLTRKHVDLDELGRLLDTRAQAPHVCRPSSASDNASVAPYPLRTTAFGISQIVATGGAREERLCDTAGQPRVVVCVGGTLDLLDAARATSISLSAGEAALIPACVGTCTLGGEAQGFLIEPNPRRN
jgi:mannose-6-phosphate isomerase